MHTGDLGDAGVLQEELDRSEADDLVGNVVHDLGERPLREHVSLTAEDRQSLVLRRHDGFERRLPTRVDSSGDLPPGAIYSGRVRRESSNAHARPRPNLGGHWVFLLTRESAEFNVRLRDETVVDPPMSRLYAPFRSPATGLQLPKLIDRGDG